MTAPDKLIAIAVAGATSPVSERIGSANTLVRRQGVWEADSTDPEGVLGPLRRREIVVRGRRAAVLGAGGAGRVAAWALSEAGAEVTLFNRSAGRAVFDHAIRGDTNPSTVKQPRCCQRLRGQSIDTALRGRRCFMEP